MPLSHLPSSLKAYALDDVLHQHKVASCIQYVEVLPQPRSANAVTRAAVSTSDHMVRLLDSERLLGTWSAFRREPSDGESTASRHVAKRDEVTTDAIIAVHHASFEDK